MKIYRVTVVVEEVEVDDDYPVDDYARHDSLDWETRYENNEYYKDLPIVEVQGIKI